MDGAGHSAEALLARHLQEIGAPVALVPAIERLETFLALSALEDRRADEIVGGFGAICETSDLSVARMMVTWRMLDPRFATQQITWTRAGGVSVQRYAHGESGLSEAFLRSPVKAILEMPEDEDMLRLSAADPDSRARFPVLVDLADEGMSEYVIWRMGFGTDGVTDRPDSGMIVSFASDRPGGFTPDEFSALDRLRYMVAVAARSAMLLEMRESVSRTYLAHSARRRVFSGHILQGSGEIVDSVIWYCDLRGSTSLCEGLGLDTYLPLLNAYFAATAGPVAAEGGDILDFIGDAVLATWPRHEEGLASAVAATRAAIAALESFRREHQDLLPGRACVADVAGIAIDTGLVKSGNIGIAERLAFSVIGPTVNQVARIERMTKSLHEPVLVTAEVAATEPGSFVSRGRFPLAGVARPMELFAMVLPAAASPVS